LTYYGAHKEKNDGLGYQDAFVKVIECLRIVTVVESAVGDAHKSLQLGVMGVLAITFEQAERCDEISLLHEVIGVWQSELLLLLGLNLGGHSLVTLDSRSWSCKHILLFLC